MRHDVRPPKLAVDANGFVWRVYDGGYWSMAPINPDNTPVPGPITFYEPVEINGYYYNDHEPLT